MDEEFADYVAIRYAHLLRVATLVLGRDHHVAADMVQDALTRVFARRRKADIQNLDAVVRRTITNLAVSRSRSEAVRRRLLPRLAVPAVHQDLDPCERDSVWTAIERLPTRQRIVLVLHYYEDMSYDEIAQLLSISPVTARTQCLRARTAMRAILEPGPEVNR